MRDGELSVCVRAERREMSLHNLVSLRYKELRCLGEQDVIKGREAAHPPAVWEKLKVILGLLCGESH